MLQFQAVTSSGLSPQRIGFACRSQRMDLQYHVLQGIDPSHHHHCRELTHPITNAWNEKCKLIALALLCVCRYPCPYLYLDTHIYSHTHNYFGGHTWHRRPYVVPESNLCWPNASALIPVLLIWLLTGAHGKPTLVQEMRQYDELTFFFFDSVKN